jgi:hypothetical protein
VLSDEELRAALKARFGGHIHAVDLDRAKLGARLAQQRERERREDIVASLVDTVNTIHREHHLAPCDVPHPVTDTLESLRDGVWQIAYAKVRSEQRHAAEVRELRAALRTAEQQRDHWRRECSDIQERAALSTKAGG